MEPIGVEGQACGHLPADAVGQRPGGVAVGQSLQGLQHHDGGHDVGRDRGAAPSRGEQVFEQRVGEQLMAVVCEERLHAGIGDELATQGGRVEQLTVRFASSLHARSLGCRTRGIEHLRTICSAVSQ